MKIIKIKTKNSESKIIIKKNYLKVYLKKVLENEQNIFVICDNKVKNIFNKIKIDKKNNLIFVEGSEKIKSFSNYEKLINKLISKNINRKSTLIAVGGGTVGDITGFIASTVLRGVNFVLAPSTFLAQIDSSIGGKNGINSSYGKNLIGTFYHPNEVIIDTSILRSLTEREIKSGYAEMIKHALIFDKNYYYWLNKNISDVLKLKSRVIDKAITKSIIIKSKIVNKDPNELSNKKISRSLLNFGHSFGHAIEAMYGYNKNINHGEAISVGMIIESKLSNYLGYLSLNDYKKIENHFLKSKLKININNMNLEKIIKFMKFDKKNLDNKLSIVLLNGIGNSFIKNNLEFNKVLSIVKKL